MRRVIVRYRVTPERVAENEALIKQVFEQLERERPAGVRYATFKLDDGVTFFHIASTQSTDNGNPLTALSAFKAFTANINARCEDPPVSVRLNEVGSYEFFNGEDQETRSAV
jgi:hypothetical protein